MNDITTCPNCLTRFIVKRANLKANQGQVKCAKCKHVFDYRKYLEASHEQTVFLGSKTTQSNPKMQLLISILLLTALTQIIFFSRLYIFEYLPSTQISFIKACRLIKCQHPLPTNIKLITLDDSELIKSDTGTDVIKFNALLSNNAHYAQAYPIIELALTNENDQTVIRKRIKPEDYAQNIQSGLKAGKEFQVRINLQTTEPVIGFRVAPIYP